MALCNVKSGASRSTGCRAGFSRQRVCVARAVAAPSEKKVGPIILNGQVLHSCTEERLDHVRSISDWLGKEVYPLIKHSSDGLWQPYDWLPKAEDPYFMDQVMELRKRTSNLPDDYLVVFVGDMITEEALPTYMNMINTLDVVKDETGASPTPWAQWTRAWVAEENRHGDVMNKYMWLTGRVNMRSVECTIQNLINTGMNPKTENNPYLGFTYTSFQERATKVSHGNTARMAKVYGDDTLARLSGLIAADEHRHEIAYQRIIGKLLQQDPNGAMLAYGDMMKKQITMPAHMMDDNEHEKINGPKRNLFADFAAVAERNGTYDAFDYADIVDYLNKTWDIPNVSGLSGEAAAAQEYVLAVPNRIRKLAERTKTRKNKELSARFSWVFNREVSLIN